MMNNWEGRRKKAAPSLRYDAACNRSLGSDSKKPVCVCDSISKQHETSIHTNIHNKRTSTVDQRANKLHGVIPDEVRQRDRRSECIKGLKE